MSNTQFLSEGLKQAFIRLISQHTGLAIRERDQAALGEKIFSRMKALKLTRPQSYYQLLECPTIDSQKEWQKFVILLTNIDSYFFRDQEQFNLLRNHIFPELIQRKRNNKSIRICSAGCSSGEEPYSLAILLQELLPDLEQWNLMILGIDINQEALQKAKTGIYTPWSFRKVDAETKQRYFRMINNQYHLDSQIKQLVNFQALNLVKNSFPVPNSQLRYMDLIICRNVFIYFEESAIAQVLDKFYKTLQPLGYLITGHAELYGQSLSQFQTKIFPESLVYQRPAKDLSDTLLASIPNDKIAFSIDQISLPENNFNIETALEKSNIKMHKTALTILKQLHPDTKISKLGNLTAAELILKLETDLNSLEGETK